MRRERGIDLSSAIYKLTYIGNEGNFPASGFWFFGVNATYAPSAKTRGKFELATTVRFGFGVR